MLSWIVRALLPLLCGCLAASATAQTTPLLTILKTELDRNYSVLKQKAEPRPYYLAYEVTEEESQVISTTLGALQSRSKNSSRALDVTLRVGSDKLDNYHSVRGDRPRFTSGVSVSLDDNPDSIARRLWSETDRIYRTASQRLINLKTNTQVNLAEEDTSDDFSPAPAVTAVLPTPALKVDEAVWTGKAKQWSLELGRMPGVLVSGVTIAFQHETKSLVNSEGTSLQHGRNFVRILIAAHAKAADGMDLGTSSTFEAEDASRLPKDAEIEAAVKKVGDQLNGLLHAPLVDPYLGPAILSGGASGVFFHEIFGHRVEGHRQKDPSEGQTFTKMVNSKVLPDFLSVVFDPTRRAFGSVDLNGYYEYDDEGVKARPVLAVEGGVLKTFLLSRSPIQNFPVSNGHGRREPGLEVVSRQSNLIVESAKQVPEKQLRQMLIDEAKRQGKPYGLYFEQVTGGYTLTQRQSVQAFKVMPIIVYKVFTDGRPDEMVRGADIVGTPLSSFSRIVATGDKAEVFNGYCGAESGSVPVSAVSPAILVSQVEVAKSDSAKDRPPLLPAPGSEAGGAR